MTEASGDAEIADWLDAQSRQLIYSELARLCVERFGDRAWSEADIRLHCWNRWEQHPGLKGRIAADPELRRFIEDRLFRWKLDDIRAACLARFGVERTPSRTAIGNHAMVYRKWLRAARDQAAESPATQNRP
jgi:hypothetical protein